ncbi:MAG TPA: TraY domain-containing protein [Candidatus Paenalcaligenes intestinipullorum]|uniref:TraY domain-containing protein n=1 Tax=Candidatus Paenalcaligenes intestinipullorum TaxID=2838718 RepID=A0A9D2RHG6_9BURK|nr:TraY domain-containing protein [Candidatus Paenalcaligenes intestinipullorum]
MSTLTSVSLRLPTELVERLQLLAQNTGRSRTFYMQEAIKQHLEDLEDLYLAEQALIDIRSGKSRLHTLDEVEQALGLDN